MLVKDREEPKTLAELAMSNRPFKCGQFPEYPELHQLFVPQLSLFDS